VGTALLAGAPITIPLPFGRSLWVSRALEHAQQAQQAHQQRQQQLPQQQLAGGQQCQQEDQHHHQQQHQQHQQRLAGVYFMFDELCGSGGSRPSLSLSGALSANDYLALVQHCGGLFVEGVPQLTPAHRDQVLPAT
jgi:predicted ATPase